MKKLKSTDITKWFISIEILKEGNINEKSKKYQLNQVLIWGYIPNLDKMSLQSYYLVMYPKNIQEFIIDNFDNLLEFINNN